MIPLDLKGPSRPAFLEHCVIFLECRKLLAAVADSLDQGASKLMCLMQVANFHQVNVQIEGGILLIVKRCKDRIQKE